MQPFVVRPKLLFLKKKHRIKTLVQKQKTEKARIKLMCKYPAIIQRPIVIDGSTAVVGRPPELVLSLVKTGKKKTKP